MQQTDCRSQTGLARRYFTESGSIRSALRILEPAVKKIASEHFSWPVGNIRVALFTCFLRGKTRIATMAVRHGFGAAAVARDDRAARLDMVRALEPPQVSAGAQCARPLSGPDVFRVRNEAPRRLDFPAGTPYASSRSGPCGGLSTRVPASSVRPHAYPDRYRRSPAPNPSSVTGSGHAQE